MKRIFLFLSIFLCSLSMAAQSAWLFNHGDSISWQPSQDMTITYEKDPAGFFWQNIQNGSFIPTRMPVWYGDEIIPNSDPYIQAEKDKYILRNCENNTFDIILKQNKCFPSYKIIGKDSNKYWLEKNTQNFELGGAFVFTFGFESNYSNSDYEAQIILEAEPLPFEPPFDENIDKRGLKDTVNVVTLCEQRPDNLLKGVSIKCKEDKHYFLPLTRPVKLSFISDESIRFFGEGMDELILSVFDVEEFHFDEIPLEQIPSNPEVNITDQNMSGDGRKIYVDTGLRINVIPKRLNFVMYTFEGGWNTVPSSTVKCITFEDSDEGCKYTFEIGWEGTDWTVVSNISEIRKFDLEVQRYYDVPQEERDALMDFYHSTGGDNWIHNENWGSDLPVNKWYGIGRTLLVDPDNISQMHVSGIGLPNNNLTGTLPASLSKLTELGQFDVQDNYLEGDFPEHPLSELMNMVDYSWFLYFGGNNFNSTIPEWAQKHPKFKEFWLNFMYQRDNDATIFDDIIIPAPDINLLDFDGNRHTSPGEYSNNKLTILYYWATWCPFSAELNTKLIPAYKQYKDAGLNVIGIVDIREYTQPRETREDIEKHCAEIGITWPNVPLEQDLEGNLYWDNVISPWRWWNEGEVPKVFAINDKGEVVFQSILYKCWPDLIPIIEEMFGPIDSEYYTSEDYSHDGETIVLQRADAEDAIDLVFMGDGFTDKDMDEGGLYEQRMTEAMEQFFIEEPYTSLRSRFNVYAVKAVSPNSVFSSSTKQAISEDNAKAFEYAKKAVGENAKRMMIGVIYNTNYAVDRSYTTMYEEDGSFVAYMMDGVSKILNHEMGGHGIALLLDEYVEPGMEGQSPREEDKAALDAAFTNYGEGANVDWRSNPSEVKWAKFITDSRYSAEKIGVYEGAWLRGHGAYRPTENSMMRYNDCGFNAPSREAIYKRVMKLSEGESWTYDYETFVSFDTPAREAYNKQNAARRVQRQKHNTSKKRIESCPPTIYKGTWRDAGKCKK